MQNLIGFKSTKKWCSETKSPVEKILAFYVKCRLGSRRNSRAHRDRAKKRRSGVFSPLIFRIDTFILLVHVLKIPDTKKCVVFSSSSKKIQARQLQLFTVNVSSNFKVLARSNFETAAICRQFTNTLIG